METERIKETLEELGFSLRDKGSYWSTSAIWRNGDNNTAIQIYKDTGVWRDFVENTPPLPIQFLIKKVASPEKRGSLLNYLNKSSNTLERDVFDSVESKPLIQMQNNFDINFLNDLLPHHKFYTDKKISLATLAKYKSGYCTSGKLYNRYVFPIFDISNCNNIVGFTGRSLIWSKDSEISKWKHIGTKRNWVYPICLSEEFKQSVIESKCIYIVESIGDSLALSENGFYNHIVTFGLDLSSFQIASILSLMPEKIVISMNNDADGEKNIGKIASIKHYIRLMDYFDMRKLYIKLPETNDLSEMHENGIFHKWVNKTIDPTKQIHHIHSFIKSNIGQFKSVKSLNKNIKLIEDMIQQEVF